jgi:rhodanese-related sulfurtransferase
MTQWRNEQRPVERIERLALEDLAERGDAVQILDVREQAERDAGYIPGSLFTPWHDLSRLPDGLRSEQPVAVVCASGQRAAVAASLLQRLGAEHVVHVVEGGVPKWGRLGHPLEVPERAAA